MNMPEIMTFSPGDEVIVENTRYSNRIELSGRRARILSCDCSDYCCSRHGNLYTLEVIDETGTINAPYAFERSFGAYGSELSSVPDKPFYLVAFIDKREVVLDNEPTFDTGKQAEDYAKELSTRMGCKVQPRRRTPKVDDETWRIREQGRLADGTYTPMPAGWDVKLIPDHFLHISSDDDAMVAFTESPERGVQDRQTRMAPGRYLERFYPYLSQRERNRLIATIDYAGEILFATTADEIEMVYTTGPESCMSYSRDKFFRNEHPTRIYAGYDLAVAYLKRNKRVSARAVVWPERKVYSRIYGDAARFKELIKGLGYTSGSLEGARIRKKYYKQQNCFMLPFVDYIEGVIDSDESDADAPLILSNDIEKLAAPCNQTSGKSPRYRMCPKYRRPMPGEFYFIHGPNEEWCESATYDYARQIDRADGRVEWWARDAQELVSVGRSWFHRDDVDLMTFVSDLSGKRFRMSSKVTLADGRCMSCDERVFFTCCGNGKNYLSKDAVYICGYSYSREYVLSRAVEHGRPLEDEIHAMEMEMADRMRANNRFYVLSDSHLEVDVANVSYTALPVDWRNLVVQRMVVPEDTAEVMFQEEDVRF